MGKSHAVTPNLSGQGASRRHVGAGLIPARASHASRLTPHASRRAFTLVEIVVVISLILFLLGLTLSVSTIVIERSEIRQTEITIRLLDTALQEREALADRQITWGRGAVYDMQEDPTYPGKSLPDDVFIISELLDTLRRAAQVKDILARIDPEFVHTYQPGSRSPYPPWIRDPAQEDAVDNKWGVQHGPQPPSLAIIDAWDTPIYPMHPGPLWDAVLTPYSPDPDLDGTARIYNEGEYGIARNRRIYFVSAGPDGRFGRTVEFPGLGGDELSQAIEKARADNIYSYQPEFTDAP